MFKFVFVAFLFTSSISFADEIVFEMPLRAVETDFERAAVTGLVFRSDLTAVKPGTVISVSIKERCTELATQAFIHGYRFAITEVSQSTDGTWRMTGSCAIRR